MTWPTDRPDQPDLMVVCNDTSHEGRRCKVASYVQHEDGGWVRQTTGDPDDPNRQTWLTGDTRLDVSDGTAGPVRTRDDLRCKLCGLNVPLRDENLRPMLDTIHAAGIASIELAHLARMVS